MCANCRAVLLGKASSKVIFLSFSTLKPRQTRQRRDGTSEETCLTPLFHHLHRMKKEELIFYLNIMACYVNPSIYACACINMHLNVPVCH